MFSKRHSHSNRLCQHKKGPNCLVESALAKKVHHANCKARRWSEWRWNWTTANRFVFCFWVGNFDGREVTLLGTTNHQPILTVFRFTWVSLFSSYFSHFLNWEEKFAVFVCGGFLESMVKDFRFVNDSGFWERWRSLSKLVDENIFKAKMMQHDLWKWWFAAGASFVGAAWCCCCCCCSCSCSGWPPTLPKRNFIDAQSSQTAEYVFICCHFIFHEMLFRFRSC